MLTRARLGSVALVFCVAAARGALADAGDDAADDAGGGGFALLPHDEMSAATRAAIQADIDRNLERLGAEGRLPAASPALAVTPQLEWPLRARAGLRDFGYHGIFALVDNDPRFPGSILDYNCGTRAYDTGSGYNHAGTDIGLWPFSWNRVDDDAVLVVAGASGVIAGKSDGNFDRNCGANGGNWNAVYVRHGDGSVAWYGHMKNGSLTTRAIGDAVAAGEVLGVVASSGSSTGPHLHLELHDSTGGTVDPWMGTCNSTSPDSWWAAQRPYNDSAINKLMTGFAAAQLNACPNPDLTNEALVFHPGDTVYFSRFYRDQLDSLPSVATIYRPDRSVFRTWSSTSPAPWYAASWWWNSFNLGPAEPTGRWQFEVVFNGRTYTHDFWLAAPGPWLLRNAAIASLAPLSPPLASIFVGAGEATLDLAGRDAVPGPGDGDDDDAYLPGFAAGQDDPDPTVLGDASRPLVFYQLAGIVTPLAAVKSGTGGITISY